MTALLSDITDLAPDTGRSTPRAVGQAAAEPPREPHWDIPRDLRGALHRPGPGCPCGCAFDSQTRRCIEPWNPPRANDLGPLFIG